MKNAPVLHAIEYAAFLGVKGPLRALPHGVSRIVGRRLGDLGWWLDRRHRKVTLNNLAMAYPELDSKEHRRLGRECFRHFGAALCDTVSSTRFDAVELCRRLSIEGWEHVQAAESLGRGTFFLSAHLGQWEIAAYPPGLYGGPLHVVGRPLDNPHLNRELESLRARFGNELIAKRGAARGMLQALRNKGRVGILIDQRVQPGEGIEVPFFGRPAVTSPLLARLVLRTGAPVVPIFGYAEPGGRYRFVAREPLYAPEDAPADDETIRALTTRYLQVTEREIRQNPELWMWMHRRWKTE